MAFQSGDRTLQFVQSGKHFNVFGFDVVVQDL
jgi:hypothetical protein